MYSYEIIINIDTIRFCEYNMIIAEGIKEAYADLFALNTSANKMTKAEVEGKFKTLTNGSKENATIGHMARSFLF